MVVKDSTSTFLGLSWLIIYRESNPLTTGQPQVLAREIHWTGSTPNTPVSALLICPVKLLYHAMPEVQSMWEFMNEMISGTNTDAIMFTLFPLAFVAMSSPSFAARCSIDANAGTEVVMTSIPLTASASVMPRQ